MSAKRTEGVGGDNPRRKGTSSTAGLTPPGGFAATLPSRGRDTPRPISPLEAEMSGRTEGGDVPLNPAPGRAFLA
jgi:hypothetical protein